MPKPRHSGKVTVSINGISLNLEFLSYNMMVLTEVAGVRSAFEYFARFEGLDQSDLKSVIYASTDIGFLLPLLIAGLANHPEYENTSARALKRKLCKLIDAEATRDGVSFMAVVSRLNNEVIPPAIASLNVADTDDEIEATDTKNDKTPEAGEAAGE